jgi:hypothetical protein
MSLKCFYVCDDAPVGPVSPEELTALGAAGILLPGTLVWIEGTANWQPFAMWAANLDAPPATLFASEPIVGENPKA